MDIVFDHGDSQSGGAHCTAPADPTAPSSPFLCGRNGRNHRNEIICSKITHAELITQQCSRSSLGTLGMSRELGESITPITGDGQGLTLLHLCLSWGSHQPS